MPSCCYCILLYGPGKEGPWWDPLALISHWWTPCWHQNIVGGSPAAFAASPQSDTYPYHSGGYLGAKVVPISCTACIWGRERGVPPISSIYPPNVDGWSGSGGRSKYGMTPDNLVRGIGTVMCSSEICLWNCGSGVLSDCPEASSSQSLYPSCSSASDVPSYTPMWAPPHSLGMTSVVLASPCMCPFSQCSAVSPPPMTY